MIELTLSEMLEGSRKFKLRTMESLVIDETSKVIFLVLELKRTNDKVVLSS
jgi:hypothetical protein